MPEHPKCDKCGGDGPMHVEVGEVISGFAPDVHKVVLNGQTHKIIHICEKCLK